MRRLNLDQLRSFVEVVDRGSFTVAARNLHLSQPAITHQLHELERRFKTPLIERLGKRAFPTQSGEMLVDYARQLLAQEESAVSAMRRFGDTWLERVRIGTSMTVLMYALPEILRKLKNLHPQLEINLKSGLTATTLEMLKSNNLDLGLCALPITDAAFVVEPLLDDELVAILPGHMKNLPRRATAKFMSELPLILGNKNSALRHATDIWLGRAHAAVKPIMEFDNVEAIKSLVAVGLGASIVPKLSLGEGHVSRANIEVVQLSPALSRKVGLVKLRGKPVTKGLQIVSDALLSLRRR
jgi:DNA-binding transcriptional LysR family regulator